MICVKIKVRATVKVRAGLRPLLPEETPDISYAPLSKALLRAIAKVFPFPHKDLQRHLN